MKRSVSKLFLAALAAAALPLAGCGVESSDPASEAEPLGSTRDELVSAGCSDPATCEDVTLNLVLDYVPQDTSWTITNSSSVVVASGDGYTAPGATVTEVIALDPGDYTFTIYASPIYGLCCWTGWGSYQLIDSSNHILASDVRSGGVHAVHHQPAAAPVFFGGNILCGRLRVLLGQLRQESHLQVAGRAGGEERSVASLIAGTPGPGVE